MQIVQGSGAISSGKGAWGSARGAKPVRWWTFSEFRARCARNGLFQSVWLTIWIAPRQPLALPRASKRRWQSRNSSCHG